VTGERELLDKAIQRYWLSDDQRAELVDALLPVVDPIANQRAAAMLRAAAKEWEALVQREKPPIRGSLWLTRRADHLDPS